MDFMRNMAFKRKISIVLLIIFANSIISPVLLRAEDPPSPDFSGFASSSTSQMVSPFSGDLNYTLPVMEIPGPEGSGYNLTLSYRSGSSPDEDASWVGYGFSLTPGSINRNVRGYPDDYKGQEVIQHNKVPINWTATTGFQAGDPEIFSFDLGLNANVGIRYNNYKGFGYNAGVGLKFGKGIVSLGYNVSDGDGSFSYNINPAANLSNIKDEKSQMKLYSGKGQMNITSGNYGLLSYSEASRPLSVTKYSGESYNISVSVTGNPVPLLLGASIGNYASYTWQKNQSETPLNAFGLLYSADAIGDNAVMDYSMEKETPYNKRDVFLGIPFTSFDNFQVSGEGINGSFRMYHKKVGQFKPNKVESLTDFYNVGAEINLIAANGFGGDVGAGEQTLEVEGWNSGMTTFSKIDDNEDEPVIFRFSGDMGGSWDHKSGEEPIVATLSPGTSVLGFKSYTASLESGISEMNNDKRSGRSSYIDYNLNSNFTNSSKAARIYTRYSIPGLNRSLASDGIGEFAITNEKGMHYVYGLPVFAKNEKNFRYGVAGAKATDIVNNIVYYSNEETKVGEVRNAPYATSYLLTTIFTPDYIDRTLDGPSDDDLGGFTKFNYTKEYGTTADNFFRWRTPYNGLQLDRGSLSDYSDDIGSVSQGEKEVYNLQSIETKSHVAIFSISLREDGYEAPTEVNALTKGAKGARTPYKLEKIDLYTKQDVFKNSSGEWEKKDGAHAIKTVNFSYDYSLCKGAPSAKNSGQGKLTLKKVWFEYNGIAQGKISPYEFQYSYPSVTYPAKYAGLKDGYSFTLEQQNPIYSSFQTDAWGSYQFNGAARFKEMRSWLSQTPSSAFDPAAWQLKVVKLPTGGEIHIQYEQDDYKYVQDKLAHVMIRASTDAAQSNVYTIDPKEIGISDPTEIEELANTIHSMYVKGGPKGDKKMYFKSLYRLLGNGTPLLEDCNVDFVTGYAIVNSVNYDAATNKINIMLGDGTPFNRTTPFYVCKDFVLTQRAGMLKSEGVCDPINVGIKLSESASEVDPEEVIPQFIGFAESLTFSDGICQSVSNEFSYLRIPVLKVKKGGGLRVKRLLMYDNNMGNPVLYGNEYIYKNIDNSSSGVATNEPPAIREENILVDYIKRGSQDVLSKIIAGKDKKQAEGPIGESALPGPSVGYSNVYIRNIHSGKTGTGFSIKEFYTAKDYPVKYKLSPIDSRGDFMLAPLLFYTDMVNNLWATQGFSFIRNEMHGQVKRDAAYSGILKDNFQMDGAALVTEQAYEYITPGAPIPVSTSYGSSYVEEPCGKEVDLTFAGKMVKDHSEDLNVEMDFALGYYIFFFIPFFGVAPSYTHSEMEMYTHASSKVINYPAVVKKVRSYNEGTYHTVENVAYDRSTGKPVTTLSYDEFSGYYLIQNIPGSWEYKNLQQKALNEGKKFNGSFVFSSLNGLDYLTSTDLSCLIKDLLIPGDLIDLGNGQLYHVEKFDDFNSKFQIVKSRENISASEPASSISQITIVRSGRMNRLSENIGSFTMHSTKDNPIVLPKDDPDDLSARWNENEKFVLFLNNRISSITDNIGSFTLENDEIFEKMNIESLISDIPEEYRANLTNSKIRHVKFLYNKSSSELQLKITSLELFYNNDWITINGDK